MKNVFVRVLTVLVFLDTAVCTASPQDIDGAGMSTLMQPYAEAISDVATHDHDRGLQEASDTPNCTLQLTLEQCINIAAQNNPGIRQKQWDTKTAVAEKNIAMGALWPEIYLGGGHELFREDRLISPRRPGSGETLQFTDNLLSGNIILTMPIFKGGRLYNQVKATELLAQSAQQELAYSHAELVFNIASMFYSILGQQQVINSLIFSQEVLREHYKRTHEMIEAQKAAHVDLLRTEVRIADIEQQLLRERNVLAIQQFVLASLLGCDREGKGVEIKGQLVLSDLPTGLSNGLAIALANRQDYQSLVSRVRVERKRLDIAHGKRWPELSVQASYGNQWDVNDFNEDNEVGLVGVFLKVPLFEGGRINAEIKRENSRLKAQEEALRKLKLQIQVEVQTVISNIESIRARVGVTEKAIEMAKESLRIEREKYNLGKGSIVDVLDAQSALLDSQVNYYRALANYNTVIVQFSFVAGET
ncbi:MAG: TolC family protein [Sedimentisphaerales bacterium]|nr:TolC family protein [Sedimentisphaerales bacterium]